LGTSLVALNAATLTTDKADYVPGEYVTFTGAGWQPGETVTIDVWEVSLDPDFQITPILSATADPDGNITNSEFQVIQSYLNQGFAAYAMGQLSGFTATATFTDSGGSYSLNWAAADPSIKAPFLPTYVRVSPAQVSCGTPSGGVGRAADPMANAVFAAPGGAQDAVESLAPQFMALGQIVPFEVQIKVTGSTAPENGVIRFTPYWLTKTTSGDDFGFNPAYQVYCAFVDTADAGTVDPGWQCKGGFLDLQHCQSWNFQRANTGHNSSIWSG
jgi:hypothetical protein